MNITPAECDLVWESTNDGRSKCVATHRSTQKTVTGYGLTHDLSMNAALDLLAVAMKVANPARTFINESYKVPAERHGTSGYLSPSGQMIGYDKGVYFPQDHRRPIDEKKARRALHKKYKEARAEIRSLKQRLALMEAERDRYRDEVNARATMYEIALDALDLGDN